MIVTSDTRDITIKLDHNLREKITVENGHGIEYEILNIDGNTYLHWGTYTVPFSQLITSYEHNLMRRRKSRDNMDDLPDDVFYDPWGDS